MRSLISLILFLPQNFTTPKKYYPHTAPPAATAESSFSFDLPKSPKSARTVDKASSSQFFTFDVESSQNSASASSNKSSHKNRVNVENKENFRSGKARENSAKNSNVSSNIKERLSFKCERLSNIFNWEGNNNNNNINNSSLSANISKDKNNESSSRKINSAPVYRKHTSSRYTDIDEPSSHDLTMFPFDREAIDYERIQRECFEVEDDDNEDCNTRRSFSYHHSNFVDADDSPFDQKIDIFQQYAIISRSESERESKREIFCFCHLILKSINL